MKNKFISLSITLLLTSSTFAATGNDIPKNCPGFAAIQAVGVQTARDTGYGWFSTSVNQYDTNVKWTLISFIIGQFNSENEAIQKGNANLSLLTNVQGPEHKQGEDNWFCIYSGNDVPDAVLITPPVDPNDLDYISRTRVPNRR